MRIRPLLLAVVMLCSGIAGGQSATSTSSPSIVSTIVAAVSQAQYTKYQHDLEKCGTGFYGGAAYNQGWADRTWYNSVKGPDGKWMYVYGRGLGNKEARLYLTDKFTAMGLSVSEVGEHHNIVATLTGSVNPSKTYIICGHFDTHPGGLVNNGPRPGGDDNASGTAGVLEAARILSATKPGCTIKFICFNGEEASLIGSREYSKNLTKSEKNDIAGLINLDMILRPGNDSDPNWKIDLDLCTQKTPMCLAWAKKYQAAAAAYVPSLPVCPTIHTGNDDCGGSDHIVFCSFFPAFMAIENTPSLIHSKASNPYYHGKSDSSTGLAAAKFDYAFATGVVQATVALIAQDAGSTGLDRAKLRAATMPASARPALIEPKKAQAATTTPASAPAKKVSAVTQPTGLRSAVR